MNKVSGLRNGLASGAELHQFAAELFPIPRSITGQGLRETLCRIREKLPNLNIHAVPSGSIAFDWTVPDEWAITGARLIGPDGSVIADYTNNNLHVVQYSEPIHCELSLEELQPHLYSIPDQPTAIPYVTSYYKRNWGFCLSHQTRAQLLPGRYSVHIDSTLSRGFLDFADLVIPGETEDEILISTYVCHPSMANNEISGPVVATYLAQWLASKRHRYTYRFVFVPETIGALVYLSKHLEHMRRYTKAGFVVTCCGDSGNFSLMPSRTGTTYADRLAESVLNYQRPGFTKYSFLQRGSDERQYCSPKVNLPVVSVMRSKYHEYPEYHTSLDDLNFVTPTALRETLETYAEIVLAAELNCLPIATCVGEPQLSKYGLYPTIGGQISQSDVSTILDVLAYADGKHDLLDLMNLLKRDVVTLRLCVGRLEQHKLLTIEPV